MSTDRRERAWVEIDAAALRRNVARIASAAGGTARLLPIVKSDAYGLGLGPVLVELEKVDPWGYGVAEVREAAAIRDAGVERPVVILNPLPPRDVPAAVEGGFQIAVSSIEEVERVAARAAPRREPAGLHLEVDTGMGRAGFDWRTVNDWGPRLFSGDTAGVRWIGVFTHFHSADEPGGRSVRAQAQRFGRVTDALRTMGPGGWIEHLCNSAAVLRAPELARDLVRPGIFLYGGRAGAELPAPDPVVSLRARVVRVREVPRGTTVGYGASHRASGRERWATVAIGYGDGLPRVLGNRGHAIVAGRKVPIIGRISMGLTVVDITDLRAADVEVGTPATFLGRDGVVSISVEEVAGLAGTISYEVFTGLSERLPRVWTGDSGRGEDGGRGGDDPDATESA